MCQSNIDGDAQYALPFCHVHMMARRPLYPSSPSQIIVPALTDSSTESLVLEEARDIESSESTAIAMLWCKKYAGKYENENADQEVVLVEKSRDESEQWECETIISTYSNLDNHSAEIEVLEIRSKNLTETAFRAPIGWVIVLKGEEKFPAGFLPRKETRDVEEEKDEKDPTNSRTK
ncbi:unnamed protein product [Fraxinus pennsylvanica]|uniref:Uncharacterized protein n=1 Tax=Fraxinus pennsylvanica TaxID=56036 RepID=A0AAD1ZTL4_9LAMI|nr:unnamed protein product [Fraxinus pennsylvanica]